MFQSACRVFQRDSREKTVRYESIYLNTEGILDADKGVIMERAWPQTSRLYYQYGN